MNKEELVQFLKDNLKIELYQECDGCGSPYMKVILKLGEEIISTGEDYLYYL